MIVVLVIDNFNLRNNGTTVSARCLAESLVSRGHEVRVLTQGNPSERGINSDTGAMMYYVPEQYIPIVTELAHKQMTVFAKPVKKTILEALDGADIVHFYQFWALGKRTKKFVRKMKIPSMAAFHMQPENVTFNIGLKWVRFLPGILYYLTNKTSYSGFTHIHCPSKFIAVKLRKFGSRSQLRVVSNGVHPDFIPGEKVAPDDDKFHILMIGRLSPEKRQDLIIKAADLSKYSDRIQLHFAGCGPLDKKLRRQGEKLGNPPDFGYYSRDELINLIRSCNLYVHASDIEIEGISCIEAFACGLVPVISDSNNSATRQFALEDENLFRSGDPVDLAKRIDYWIEHPEHIDKSSRLYIKFASKFSLKHSIRRMEVLYRDVLADENVLFKKYMKGIGFKVFSRLLHSLIAFPLLYIWCIVFMGARIKGTRNLLNVKGALTVCNHVHNLDSVIVALALFPRKAVFPTLPENLNSLWPGILVNALGGVPVPERPSELKMFMDEMELLLRCGRVLHFFPEGELLKYDRELREFKRGAFQLASGAHVPVVPMRITYKDPGFPRKLLQKNPVMVLRIGKPISPSMLDSAIGESIGLQKTRRVMEELNHRKVVNE